MAVRLSGDGRRGWLSDDEKMIVRHGDTTDGGGFPSTDISRNTSIQSAAPEQVRIGLRADCSGGTHRKQ